MRPPSTWKFWIALTLVALCSGMMGAAVALRVQNQRMARQTGLFSEALKERLITRLELTSEQQKEIRPILDAHQDRLRAVIADAMAQSSRIGDELVAEIKPLLTPEQREQLEQLLLRRDQFRERLRERWTTNETGFQQGRGLLRELWRERVRNRATNAPPENDGSEE
jgi:Spy/CpxP family protein refolding chaperone